MTPQQRLSAIAADLREGKPSPSASVREFLSWFGALRRGPAIVANIRRTLEAERVSTSPDFESAYLDSPIQFAFAASQGTELPSQQPQVVEAVASLASTATVTAVGTVVPPLSSAYADPTYRISKLAAANNRPIAVTPDTRLSEAATIMLANDFSQLPVMTTHREVKGVVSWASIGSRLALGRNGAVARELMDAHQEIASDASIFQAIPVIVKFEYVLVRSSDNMISGIVTASDLSLQFRQLAEPFLLLGEIENRSGSAKSDRGIGG